MRSEKERSNDYWTHAAHFVRFDHKYESLRDATDDSHVIVVGRISRQRLGEVESFSSHMIRQSMITTVEVEDVLKGEIVSRSPGTIEIADLGASEIAHAELPAGRYIFFLRSQAQWRLEEGEAPASDPNDQYYYMRRNGYQCVLREIDGLVDVIEGYRGWAGEIGPYPSQLDGESFSAVVERVRALAGS